MKRILFCGVLLLGHSAAAAEATVSADELLDRVWAGHPVSFALLTERGHQFVAYDDADLRLTVAGRKLGATTWTRVQPSGLPSAHARSWTVPGAKRLSA